MSMTGEFDLSKVMAKIDAIQAENGWLTLNSFLGKGSMTNKLERARANEIRKKLHENSMTLEEINARFHREAQLEADAYYSSRRPWVKSVFEANRGECAKIINDAATKAVKRVVNDQ